MRIILRNDACEYVRHSDPATAMEAHRIQSRYYGIDGLFMESLEIVQHMSIYLNGYRWLKR